MKTAIVIPAYNEESCIGKVISSIRSEVGLDVVVVDDCSTDKTREVASISGASVVSFSNNCGYNIALHCGIKYAKENGYSHAITLDADGQHPIDLISDFVKKFTEGFPFVFGKREHLGRWAERVFASYTYTRYGLSDPLCGMKGYDLEILGSLGEFPNYDSTGTEILLWVLSSNYSWTQINKRKIDRDGFSKFGEGIKPNLDILLALYRGVSRARKY